MDDVYDKAWSQIERNPPFLAVWCRLIEQAVNRLSRRPLVHVAAESVGYETMSLALRLDRLGLLDRVELSASEYDADYLRAAISGRIPKHFWPRLQSEFLSSIIPTEDGQLVVDEALWSQVRHFRHDLVIDDFQEPFDLISASNLICHLSLWPRRAVVLGLLLATVPGGFIALGGVPKDGIFDILGRFSEAVDDDARAIHDAWRQQRAGWKSRPRPYWALPPWRKVHDAGYRYGCVFRRRELDLAGERSLMADLIVARRRAVRTFQTRGGYFRWVGSKPIDVPIARPS